MGISLIVHKRQKSRKDVPPQLEPWIPREEWATEWSTDPSKFWPSPLWNLDLNAKSSVGRKLAEFFDKTEDHLNLCWSDRIRRRHLCLLHYDLLNQFIPERQGRERITRAECKRLAHTIVSNSPRLHNNEDVVSRLQQLSSFGLKYDKLICSFGSGITVVLPEHLDSYM